MRFSFIILLSALLLLPAVPQTLGAQQETVIFLVRHAERADDETMDPPMAMDPQMTEDPPLSDAGRNRASLLAEMLRDSGISHIHSTNYRRTRETARLTAEGAGLEVHIYDASDLFSFASQLRATPGRHLVVGHSNTTHSLVEALGGDPGSPIETLEYDRMYIVTVDEGSSPTVLLRFGDPFVGSESGKP